MSPKIDVLKDKIYSDDNAILGEEAMNAAFGHEITFAGGIMAKRYKIPAGSEVLQHAHNYDHISIFTGTIELIIDDDHEETIMASEPMCLVIQKGKIHGIRAVTDTVWFCIHNEETALWPSSQD